MTSPLPTRFLDAEAARERLGDRVDQVGAALLRRDPLADDLVAAFADLGYERGWALFERAVREGIEDVDGAPGPMVAFFEQVESVPGWVDWEAVNRGGEPLLRSTAFGALSLGLNSLVLGYCSPGGNKPLVFSGRLREQAARRLNETARFVYEVSVPDGLRRGADGYSITLRVRAIHAQVRALIDRSGRWRVDEWGAPINQHDMLATALLFSLQLSDGLRQFGFRISPDESEAQIALWRYVGALMGVEPALLPRTEAEARAVVEVIESTQGPPDRDSRDLVDALVRSPVQAAKTEAERRRAERQVGLAQGMCRALVGEERADQLHLPRTGWRHVVPVVRRLIAVREAMAGWSPGAHAKAVRRGDRKWQAFLDGVLEGEVVAYDLPTRLVGWR